MNCIQAILTIDMDNLPDNFQEIIKHEQEVIAKWKEENILTQFFLKQSKDGAVLLFNSNDEQEVHGLMTTLPLYKLKKSIEYLRLIKQF